MTFEETSGNTEKTPSRGGRLTWKKLLILTITVMSATVLVGLVALQMWRKAHPLPQVVHPGEIIDTFGEYQSRNGRLQILVGPGDFPGKFQWKTSTRNSSSKMNFDASADWFATIDQDDQAWLYTSKDGVFKWRNTPTESVTTNVGAGGGWEGIPETFLVKLPEKHRTDYETWAKNQGLLPAE